MWPFSAAQGNHSGTERVHKTQEKAGAVLKYLADTARSLTGESARGGIPVKLILSSQAGHIVRCDFLKTRMVACRWVHSVHHFVKPQQYLGVPDLSDSGTAYFLNILQDVAGAIVVHPSYAEDFYAIMQSLDRELEDRLAYPWTLASPLTQNRLVIVSHRHPAVMADYLASCYAHGIRVTLVDAEGQFVPPESQSGAVDQCIPVDMTRDEQLSTRIVDAISPTQPYHGIVTFTDTFMFHTAKAAEALGLYTLPLDIVKTCLDKHATRLFCQGVLEPLRIKSQADLLRHLETPGTRLEYPLIVKPCTSWGSQGVHKVATEAELLDAVSRASFSAKEIDLLIDSYIDGPEVDANFVLLDGKILYFELVDGFPCPAEMPKSDNTGDFIETDQLWPSNHPQNERDLVRDGLHDLLLQIGIRDGVFHVEARIRNSAVHYERQGGVIDLRPRSPPPSDKPSIFLLEVNQRPPGHGGSWGTAVSYGIDYPVLHMFCALREPEYYKSLCRPFRRGAVQHVNSLFINSATNGIYQGEDVCRELRKQRPDLAQFVQYCNCYYEKGESVTDSPARVALFVVASPVSREKVLEVSRELRNTVRVKVQ